MSAQAEKAGRTASADNTSSPLSAAKPLVVDLDGTLIATDMLMENACWVAGHAPHRLLGLPFWLSRGRSHLKAGLADVGIPPIEKLPLNEECLALIASARSKGAKIVLASASDERIVTAIATSLGLFDEWYGSTRERNLSGQAKADLLVQKFGRKGFDYVGDSFKDQPVWAQADRAISLGATAHVRRTLDASHDNVTHIDAPKSGSWARTHIKALRPHQWAKNLLVFLPMLASHDLSPANIFQTVVAFISLSLLASSVYIVNDLVDLAADRSHPRKSRRPFASGAIPIRDGLVMAPLLLVGSLSLAIILLPPQFLLVLGAYYAGTIGYSFWLKQKALIDVVLLAGLYTVRIIAGNAATGIEFSQWMLAFSMFLFFALAIVKRQTELVDMLRTNDGRTLKRGYMVEDLPLIQAMGAASGYVSVLVLALYLNSVAADALYKSPKILWLVCPLLLYWISRMLLLGTRGQMHDDPIVFTTKDYVSYLVGTAIAAVVAASMLI